MAGAGTTDNARARRVSRRKTAQSADRRQADRTTSGAHGLGEQSRQAKACTGTPRRQVVDKTRRQDAPELGKDERVAVHVEGENARAGSREEDVRHSTAVRANNNVGLREGFDLAAQAAQHLCVVVRKRRDDVPGARQERGLHVVGIVKDVRGSESNCEHDSRTM